MTDTRSADPPPRSLDSVGPVASFTAFWPVYLGEHRRPLTRHIHVVGTLCGLAMAAASPFAGPLCFFAGVVVAYGLAWIAHYRVERNRPASFRYPLWSLWGDLKMTLLFVSGQLDAELRQHRIGLS